MASIRFFCVIFTKKDGSWWVAVWHNCTLANARRWLKCHVSLDRSVCNRLRLRTGPYLIQAEANWRSLFYWSRGLLQMMVFLRRLTPVPTSLWRRF